jgi:hypothetical protein
MLLLVLAAALVSLLLNFVEKDAGQINLMLLIFVSYITSWSLLQKKNFINLLVFT